MDKFCKKCNNTKKFVGTGYMQEDCDACNDDQIEIDKTSASYKKAIKQIMSETKASKAEAELMFAKEYSHA